MAEERIIQIYDLYDRSGLGPFYKRVKDEGWEIEFIEDLSKVRSPDLLIINPLLRINGHWRGIKEYLDRDEETSVILFSPLLTESDIVRMVGNHENVEVINPDKKSIQKLYDLVGLKNDSSN